MDALTLPPNAYLIAGEKVQPLDKPIITIGRSLENQLVIDHPSVSRNHAQLRALNGHFVLFDLSSSAGTFINGQRISQAALYPGDVISIAEIALIYGQDNPPPRLDLNETIKVF